MRGCYQSTVVADDDVNLQPWFDVAQRTTTAHVPLQPLDFSLVKEQPIRSITAHLGAKAFEKFNHEGGGDRPLSKASFSVEGVVHCSAPLLESKPSSSAVRGRKPTAVTMPQLPAVFGRLQ